MSASRTTTVSDARRLTITDLVPLSEAGLQALDAVTETQPLDDRLFSTTPGRDLNEALGALISALRSLDVGRVLAKSSWWHRLTGADLEARLNFELACRDLAELQERARQHAVVARKAGSLLWKSAQTLKADHKRLEAALAICRAAACEPGIRGNDPALYGRFQRRGANLVALLTSQAMAIKQADIAIALLSNLLDRHLEIERLVLPIWQHAGMAATQAGARRSSARKIVSELRQTYAEMLAGAEALMEPDHV